MNQIFGNPNNNQNNRNRQQNNRQNNMNNYGQQGYNNYNQQNYNNFNYNSNMNYNYQNMNNNQTNKTKKIKETKTKKEKKVKNSYSGYSVDTNTKTDIRKVLKVFSIILIIIGIGMIAKSGYAISVNKTKQKDNVEVLTDKMGKEVTITINSNYPIKNFTYKWNSGEESRVEGDGTVSISRTIDIPNGNNVLKISITDYYGNKTDYMKQYIYESTDTEKPNIEIAKVGNKLKITATDNNKMSYLTYCWNDGETERVDADSDTSKEISTEIDVEKGESKLYVTAVDGEDNRQTRTEKIIAASKPTFTITTEGSNIIIEAKDEVGVKNITVNIDGQEYSQDVDQDNLTDVKGSVPVSSGTHNIKVTVTNSSGVQADKEMSVSV